MNIGNKVFGNFGLNLPLEKKTENEMSKPQSLYLNQQGGLPSLKTSTALKNQLSIKNSSIMFGKKASATVGDPRVELPNVNRKQILMISPEEGMYQKAGGIAEVAEGLTDAINGVYGDKNDIRKVLILHNGEPEVKTEGGKKRLYYVKPTSPNPANCQRFEIEDTGIEFEYESLYGKAKARVYKREPKFYLDGNYNAGLNKYQFKNTENKNKSTTYFIYSPPFSEAREPYGYEKNEPARAYGVGDSYKNAIGYMNFNRAVTAFIEKLSEQETEYQALPADKKDKPAKKYEHFVPEKINAADWMSSYTLKHLKEKYNNLNLSVSIHNCGPAYQGQIPPLLAAITTFNEKDTKEFEKLVADTFSSGIDLKNDAIGNVKGTITNLDKEILKLKKEKTELLNKKKLDDEERNYLHEVIPNGIKFYEKILEDKYDELERLKKAEINEFNRPNLIDRVLQKDFTDDNGHNVDMSRGRIDIIKNFKYMATKYPIQMSYLNQLITRHPQLAHISWDKETKNFNTLADSLKISDIILPVSQGFKNDILTSDKMSGSLRPILEENKDKVLGIANGLDKDVKFNSDKLSPGVTFNLSNFHDGKAANKAILQELLKEKPQFDNDGKICSDDVPNTPMAKNSLTGFLKKDPTAMINLLVSRYDITQKGIDYAIESAKRMIEDPECSKAQFIISCGKNLIDKEGKILPQFPLLKGLEEKIEKDPRYKGRIVLVNDFCIPALFNAGSDITMMPSNFEPCGITQMEGMAVGTPVVASNTGGLIDTVVDIDENPELATGFKTKVSLMYSSDPAGEYTALMKKAYKTWEQGHTFENGTKTVIEDSQWNKVTKNAYNYDSRWPNVAVNYIEDAFGGHRTMIQKLSDPAYGVDPLLKITALKYQDEPRFKVYAEPYTDSVKNFAKFVQEKIQDVETKITNDCREKVSKFIERPTVNTNTASDYIGVNKVIDLLILGGGEPVPTVKGMSDLQKLKYVTSVNDSIRKLPEILKKATETEGKLTELDEFKKYVSETMKDYTLNIVTVNGEKRTVRDFKLLDEAKKEIAKKNATPLTNLLNDDNPAKATILDNTEVAPIVKDMIIGKINTYFAKKETAAGTTREKDEIMAKRKETLDNWKEAINNTEIVKFTENDRDEIVKLELAKIKETNDEIMLTKEFKDATAEHDKKVSETTNEEIVKHLSDKLAVALTKKNSMIDYAVKAYQSEELVQDMKQVMMEGIMAAETQRLGKFTDAEKNTINAEQNRASKIAEEEEIEKKKAKKEDNA